MLPAMVNPTWVTKAKYSRVSRFFLKSFTTPYRSLSRKYFGRSPRPLLPEVHQFVKCFFLVCPSDPFFILRDNPLLAEGPVSCQIGGAGRSAFHGNSNTGADLQ